MITIGNKAKPIKEIDLNIDNMSLDIFAQSVPYKGHRSFVTNNTGPIRMFMVISVCGLEHAISYLFFSEYPTVENVTEIITANASYYGNNIVVIDTGEAFHTNKEVDDKALALKEALPKANVYVPAIVIEPQ